MRSDDTMVYCFIIRQKVVYDNTRINFPAVTLTSFPSPFQIAAEIVTNQACGFFNLIHNVCLVHKVNKRSLRELLLEVVSEEFATNIQASDCLLNRAAVD